MPKDRDQLTPEEPEDRATLDRSRGQGTGGTGYDRLPSESAPGNIEGNEGEAGSESFQDVPPS